MWLIYPTCPIVSGVCVYPQPTAENVFHEGLVNTNHPWKVGKSMCVFLCLLMGTLIVFCIF